MNISCTMVYEHLLAGKAKSTINVLLLATDALDIFSGLTYN